MAAVQRAQACTFHSPTAHTPRAIPASRLRISDREGLGPSRDQVQILRKCREERRLAELLAFAGRTNRTKFRDQVIRPMLQAGWLALTLPDKPRSSKQRYRITAEGLQVLPNVRKQK